MIDLDKEVIIGQHKAILDMKSSLHLAIVAGDTQKAFKIKELLESSLNEIRSDLIFGVSETERIDSLRKQYDANLESLKQAGITYSVYPRDEYLTRDGVAYPVPSFESVASALYANKDLVRDKTKQGFKKLLLVPFGKSVTELYERYVDQLKSLSDSKQLFYSDGQHLTLDVNPVNDQIPKVAGLDNSNLVFYYPNEFSENHQGKTKYQVMKDLESGPFPGWNVLLIEDLPGLPKAGAEKTISGRKQLSENNSPEWNLKKILTDPVYGSEIPLTPEDYLTYALLHLLQTKKPLDCMPFGYEVAFISVGVIRLLDDDNSTVGAPNFRWNTLGRRPQFHLHNTEIGRGTSTRTGIRIN